MCKIETSSRPEKQYKKILLSIISAMILFLCILFFYMHLADVNFLANEEHFLFFMFWFAGIFLTAFMLYILEKKQEYIKKVLKISNVKYFWINICTLLVPFLFYQIFLIPSFFLLHQISNTKDKKEVILEDFVSNNRGRKYIKLKNFYFGNDNIYGYNEAKKYLKKGDKFTLVGKR